MTIEKSRRILNLTEGQYSDEEMVQLIDFTDMLVNHVYNKLKVKYSNKNFTEEKLQSERVARYNNDTRK